VSADRSPSSVPPSSKVEPEGATALVNSHFAWAVSGFGLFYAVSVIDNEGVEARNAVEFAGGPHRSFLDGHQ
jgi:hypothetical protein